MPEVDIKKCWFVMLLPLAAGLLAVALLLLGLPAGQSLAQDTVNRAHVVVQFSDGRTAVRPITWTGTISRVAALKAAGFTVEHSGDAVCNIAGEGCPASNCFCTLNFWAQGQWKNTAWDESWPPPLLKDGDVILFRNASSFGDWGLTGKVPAAPVYVAASDALEWMRTQQQGDGSYDDGFSKMGASVRALIALGAAGYDPDEWGNPSLLDFLASQTPTLTAYVASSAAAAGKLTVGAAWAGQTVTDFLGLNLPLSITAFYSQTTGQYGNGSGDTAWAVLGLYAADETIPANTVNFLKSVQNTDGGWTWNEWGKTSEVQHTALVVQALLAAGEPVSAPEIGAALKFIAGARNADGGYGYQTGSDSDVDTTAFVLQTLLSADEGAAGNWCATLRCGYLLSAQNADGSFSAWGAPSLYATQEAIPALMHRPYGPLAHWTYNCYAGYLPLVTKGSGQ